MFYATLSDTPVGPLLLAADDWGLQFVRFSGAGAGKSRSLAAGPDPEWQYSERRLKEPMRQLKAYFRKQLTQFELPLAPVGTDFQRRVWRALCDIPYGETASYGEIAQAVGQPTASRAVGMANGRNPIAIVVPCHRIIGSTGKLVGFGGGLARKSTLLELEQRQRGSSSASADRAAAAQRCGIHASRQSKMTPSMFFSRW